MDNEEIEILNLQIGSLKIRKKTSSILGCLWALNTVSNGILYGFVLKPNFSNVVFTVLTASLMSINFGQVKQTVIILELESGRLKIPNMFKLLVPGIGILMNITLVTTASFTIGESSSLLYATALLEQGLVTTYIEGVLNGTEEYIESKMRL